MTERAGPGRRFLRAAGLSALGLSGVPAVLMLFGLFRWGDTSPTLPAAKFVVWLVAALLFAAAFWFTSADAGRERQGRWATTLLALQSATGLAMFELVCTGLETMLLVVVAAQLGLFVRLPAGLGWVGLQTVGLALLGVRHWGLPWSLGWAGVIALPMEVLALFTSYFAASQARAGHELARANAELEATQELLAESRQIAERARISRELHDLLGHHLTALSLGLEAARHQSAGPARAQIETCQDLARGLLDDVRDVVRALRGEASVDLGKLLAPLVAGIPRPSVHLSVPEGLAVDHPERAHALVRCVQETVTNAMRHARASNLWVDVRRHDDRLEIEARDDGRGTRSIRPGQGLEGMRERVEALGGGLEIESRPGEGFRLRAWVPAGARR